MALGTVISLPFSGLLADTLGWESVFYVQGGLALVWCLLWLSFVYDSPHEHPWIHDDELKLFSSSISVQTDTGKQNSTDLEETQCYLDVAVPILDMFKPNDELYRSEKEPHGHSVT